MIQHVKRLWAEKPLYLILVTALAIRLVSVVFSAGYGMHDDHFLVIEPAQSWLAGFDYNNWLPENAVGGQPSGHSFFYPGLHYLFFKVCASASITDPRMKMLLVRLIHALISLLTVLYGYRIANRISGPESAKIAGLLLALYWFYPILSVRNMVEMVSTPFSLMSCYCLIKNKRWRSYALSGLYIGIAMGVRVQMYLIFGGIGLVLLINREWLGTFVFGISALIIFFITQIADLFLWHRPFAEMIQYIIYNSNHYDDYIVQSTFLYVIFLSGLLIPPVSIYLWFGYFRNWRKGLLLFLPSFIFLIFHSIYPNKQERFILPFIPYLIILGISGWKEFRESSQFWKARPGLYGIGLKFFWTLNLLALVFVSPAYTKKSRVEVMNYLGTLSDVRGLLIDRTANYGCYMLPRFYMGNWDMRHECFSLEEKALWKDGELEQRVEKYPLNYILFVEETDVENRVAKMKLHFPSLEFVTKFEPSYIDRMLHKLNPRNQNEVIYLYRK